MTSGSALYDFIAYRRAAGERVYAIADAARDRDLAFAARDRFGQPIRWLFTKGTVREMENVAPYLVSMTVGSSYPYSGSGYLDLWAARLGNSAGILLLTPADEDSLWTHLREVFRVTDDERHKYYFRFYDPRVLRTFLPTCTGQEAQELFGPIRQMLVESQNADRLLVCRTGHRGVVASEFPVVERGASEAARR
jgi:hypothetical protein